MTPGLSFARRREAERRGRRAETFATLFLIAKGYRILARRLRTHAGEIDLVARSPKGVLCFVEVKTRGSLGDAREALLPRQRHRIAHAAEFYLARLRGLPPRGVRFDVVVFSSGRFWPVHLKDAWRPDGA